MIVVDSSAFIEYYREGGSQEAQHAVAEAIRGDLVAVNGMIQTEMVAFAADASTYRKLISDFSSFHWLDLDRAVFDLAGEIGFSLRRERITVPATDLIIAASAIRENATLYHVDAHYDLISKHSQLDAKNLHGKKTKKTRTGSLPNPE